MTTILTIQNLKCKGCITTIERMIAKLPNVSCNYIDLDENQIHLSYDSKVDLDTLELKLRALGYPVANKDNSLGLKTRSYVSCALGKI